jgi:hypothetical protein
VLKEARIERLLEKMIKQRSSSNIHSIEWLNETRKAERKNFLLYEFSLLPPQVFAVAFAAFRGCRCVSASAVSTDFHVQPGFLCYRFL